MSLAGWLCECCSTIPGCPDGVKQDSTANFLPQPGAGMVVNGGGGRKEQVVETMWGTEGTPPYFLGPPGGTLKENSSWWALIQHDLP